MRLVTYNCMSMQKHGRYRDICKAFVSAELFTLTGTRDRQQADQTACTRERIARHHVYSFPTAGRAARHSNRVCGVAIGVRHEIYASTRIHKLFIPERDLQGRLGGVWMRDRSRDLAVFAVHMPINNGDAAQLKTAHAVIKRLKK